jgi:hypothetical protein
VRGLVLPKPDILTLTPPDSITLVAVLTLLKTHQDTAFGGSASILVPELSSHLCRAVDSQRCQTRGAFAPQSISRGMSRSTPDPKASNNNYTIRENMSVQICHKPAQRCRSNASQIYIAAALLASARPIQKHPLPNVHWRWRRQHRLCTEANLVVHLPNQKEKSTHPGRSWDARAERREHTELEVEEEVARRVYCVLYDGIFSFPSPFVATPARPSNRKDWIANSFGWPKERKDRCSVFGEEPLSLASACAPACLTRRD